MKLARLPFARNLLGALSVYILVTGCSSEIIDNDSPPEAQFAEGERLIKHDRYVEGVERYRILKSRYPYSKYAALATLKIGDAHFQEEAFLEAASAYKIFRELYPKHEQAGYALFRIAESHYNLLPGSVDRDLEPANSALDAYNQFQKDYPAAPQQKEAETRVRELREKLADREDYVGEFYFIREQYQAASLRYKYLLENYPETKHKEDALYRMGLSYERTGEYRKASDAVAELEQTFPKGKYEKKIASLKESIAKSLGNQE